MQYAVLQTHAVPGDDRRRHAQRRLPRRPHRHRVGPRCARCHCPLRLLPGRAALPRPLPPLAWRHNTANCMVRHAHSCAVLSPPPAPLSRTYSKFGTTMRFNLRHSFPLLTTKRVFWRGERGGRVCERGRGERGRGPAHACTLRACSPAWRLSPAKTFSFQPSLATLLPTQPLMCDACTLPLLQGWRRSCCGLCRAPPTPSCWRWVVQKGARCCLKLRLPRDES